MKHIRNALIFSFTGAAIVGIVGTLLVWLIMGYSPAFVWGL